MMSHFVTRQWKPVRTDLARKDRQPGTYRAFVPDLLGTQLPQCGSAAQAAAEDALIVLARADERVGERGRFLSHLLVRSESISSSWIEGNRITPKKLAIAEAVHHGSQVALDVIANVQATEDAIAALAAPGRIISSGDIENLQHLIEPRLPRGLRQEQNWVGGPGISPLRADFIPPPEQEVPRLIDDLADFLSASEGNPVVRAAIAHAQFETIHPFIDGNGRTGRALIHTVLSRTGAVRNAIIPISTVFAGETNSYIAGLTAFRQDKVDEWVQSFAEATILAAENAVQLADDVERLDQQLWDSLLSFREQQGLSPIRPRRDSVLTRILAGLAAEPVLTLESAGQRYRASTAAVHRALTSLTEAGILSRTKDHKGRLICWTSDRHLSLVSLTERSNRVGGADTSHRKPNSGPPSPPRSQVGELRERGVSCG